MPELLAAYRAKLAQGELRQDSAQEAAIAKLESLAKALKGYRPSTAESGFLSYLGIGNRRERGLRWNVGDDEIPVYRQGLYLYGEVGQGKSMVMDLFFAHNPVPHKRRVHFLEFMREIHAELHRLREDRKVRETDPIPLVARHVAETAWLLCFDEFQVSDIADAMILGRLFQALFDLDVIVVATSNRAPDDLYKGGLQRDRFLPFIELIKGHLDVLELNGGRDYRLGREPGAERYFTPLGPEAEAGMAECFARLSGGAPPKPESQIVLGRTWMVPRSAPGVAWFTFTELCRASSAGTGFGPADFVALATLYHTVMLSDIPLLTPDERDAARRFVTLIDALYDHRVSFICSAAAPPARLYPEGDGSFEFQRTASRLMEMQSVDYLDQLHLT